MASQSTNPARGMRDFLPVDVRKREYVIGIIKEVYESYGFEPLETPAVENLETLTGKYGEDGNQLIFKILKRRNSFEDELEHFVDNVKEEFYDDNNPLYPPEIENDFCDLALRYDLTVPLARVVANYKNDLPKFFKRYQIQPVWRADRPARGRFREFYQCDVDTIGSRSMLVEAEQISAVCEILERLGFEDYKVNLNHRKILTSLLDVCEVPQEKHTAALIILDKALKIGGEATIQEFEKSGLRSQGIKLAKFFYQIFERKNKIVLEKERVPKELLEDINNDTFEALEALISNHPESNRGIAEIKEILRFTKIQKVEKIDIDPSLARGLSYYTGAIFEIELFGFTGSLGGGGRYDGLIGMFGKEEIPACGFSLGLERILVVMEERGMFPEHLQNSAAADVMVTIWNEESIGESLKLASELREKGLRVLVYPEADKLAKQFKYADSMKISFVCVLGESELAENKVTLKNMKSGAQETLSRSEIAEKIK